MDRQYFSAGFGYDIDRNTALNLCYTKGYWTKDTIDDLTPGGTHESIQTDRILGGISFKF